MVLEENMKKQEENKGDGAENVEERDSLQAEDANVEVEELKTDGKVEEEEKIRRDEQEKEEEKNYEVFVENEAEEKVPMLGDEAGKKAEETEDNNKLQNGTESKATADPELGDEPSSPSPLVEVTSDKCTKPPSCLRCMSRKHWDRVRKILIGLAIGLSVAVSWVAATQFITEMYSPEFDAPFFLNWFTTAWMLVCYPIYLVGSMVLFPETRRAGWKALYKEDQKIYGSRGMTVWHCLRLTGPFLALWMITNYMYAAALKLRAPTDVTAIFVTNTAFIYIFSWIWLEELLILLPARLCSVLLSIVGTIMVMLASGFGGSSIVGVLLALGAAIGAALYKVLFKRFLGDATYGQVSLFLTMLGLLDVLLLWPIVLALSFTGVETLNWSNLPWDFLCGVSLLSIVFNFLVNFGIAITYPLLISLANIVGIPINGVIDSIFREYSFTGLQIGGSVLIILGFLIMLVPESWQARVACWTEGNEPCRRCCSRGTRHRLPGDDPATEQAEMAEVA